ncbi:MAG TPA: response regulator transcription factor [Actinomycetota bacterium]|nr:response regulator transcription factor [Actinomycetota bacterium]
MAESWSVPSEQRRPIRVFVVDDHAVVRRGIRAYLDMIDDMELVGEAQDGRQALNRIQVLIAEGRTPEVVVMDLVMPDMDGIEATAALKDLWPEIAVVAVTSFTEMSKIHGALDAGASGYLLKDAEADELVRAIRAVHRGDLHLDPVVARELTKSLQAPRAQNDDKVLTQREREVLKLVAQGLSNKSIASRLSISERTARTYVSNILTKLGLASRTQAALWAIREGISPPP